MRTLAIAQSTNALNYAIFDGVYLDKYGVIKYYSVKELYDIIMKLLEEHIITYVVVNQIDYVKMKHRKDAFDLIKFRTTVKLACAIFNHDDGDFFLEIATSGWEQYLFGDRIQGVKLAKEKIRIVNQIYQTKLKYDTKHIETQGQHLADAIVLGQSYSQGRLNHIRKGVYSIWAKEKSKAIKTDW